MTAQTSKKRGNPLGGSGAVRPKKGVPAFKTEAEEREFWETHESTAYVDWSPAEPVRLPNLKPSTPINEASTDARDPVGLSHLRSIPTRRQ